MVRFSKTRKNPARCIGNYSVYLLFLMPPAGLSPYWSSTAFPSRRDVGIREKLFESCTKSRRRLLSRISKYASLFTYAPGRTRTYNNCFEGSHDIHFTTGAPGHLKLMCRLRTYQLYLQISKKSKNGIK